MNTLGAFVRGQAAQGNPHRVFDWDKAATILKEKNVKNAGAGLQGDLEWTSGDILEDGKIPEDHYCYLSSNWAIPVLVIDLEEIECWKYENDTPDWGPETFWPESAKKIFFG